MTALPSPLTPQATEDRSTRAALGVLVAYLGPLWPRVLLLALLLFSSVGLTLWLPQLLATFLDTAKAGGALSVLTRLAVTYIVVALTVQFLSAGATYIGADVGWAATNRLRADLMRHLLHLDMSFHKERTPGELIERVDGDVTALSNFFSQFAVRVFGAGLLLLGALVMFWRERWWLGLGVTCFALLTLWTMNRVRRVGVEPTRLEREESARLFGYIEERLSGLDDVRSLGAGEHHLRRYLMVQRGYFWKAYQAWFKRSTVWRISMLLFTVGYAAVVSAAVGLYLGGAISIGTAFLFYQYMSLVEEPIDQLTQQLQDLQKAGASLVRVGELLNLRSALPTGAAHLPPGPPELQFDHLSFEYEDDSTRVLSGVTFTLGAGRTLGLLGRTGSGKTTLTRLLSRLYDPTGGEIRVAGQPTTALDLKRYRQRLAVVTQDVQLFQASVRDNLTFFAQSQPGVTPQQADEPIIAALHEVGLDGWLASLERGLDTPLPVGSLSAGEAQLLAFARVMLLDPDLIILDEPSSRLDPATEAQLTQATWRLLAGRTAIVIAHRLDTVARADDILVLGAGELLEYGPRAALADDPHSRYSALLRAASGQASESDLKEALEVLA